MDDCFGKSTKGTVRGAVNCEVISPCFSAVAEQHRIPHEELEIHLSLI